MIQALTSVGFLSTAALSNNGPFGACLVWDLVGLSIGRWNDGQWGQVLAGTAAATAAVVGYKNFA